MNANLREILKKNLRGSAGNGFGECRTLVLLPAQSAATPDEALDALKKFARSAGDKLQGWVRFADNRDLVFPRPDNGEAVLQGWPLEAELTAGGETSLHLCLNGQGGWKVQEIREAPDAEAFLLETEYLVAPRHSRNGAKTVKYQVAYALQSVGSHQEFQPVACRFAGFNHKNT